MLVKGATGRKHMFILTAFRRDSLCSEQRDMNISCTSPQSTSHCDQFNEDDKHITIMKLIYIYTFEENCLSLNHLNVTCSYTGYVLTFSCIALCLPSYVHQSRPHDFMMYVLWRAKVFGTTLDQTRFFSHCNRIYTQQTYYTFDRWLLDKHLNESIYGMPKETTP